MLCFACIDGFLDIQAAFRDCVEQSIAEKLRESRQDSCTSTAIEIEPTKCTKAQIDMPNDIITDLDLNKLGDFEEYLMLPSLALLDSPKPVKPKIRKTFMCEHCAKKFTKKYFLRKHIESKHQKSHEKRVPRPKNSSKATKIKVKGKKPEEKPKRAVHEGILSCFSAIAEAKQLKIPVKPLSSCEVCPKVFQSERILALHKKTHQITLVVGKYI